VGHVATSHAELEPPGGFPRHTIKASSSYKACLRVIKAVLFILEYIEFVLDVQIGLYINYITRSIKSRRK
jgi:hypothetical protein